MSEQITVLVEINGVREEKTLVENKVGFDAMTGEAKVEQQVSVGFDAMTGQPKYESVEQIGFDGESGKPVYALKNPGAMAAVNAAGAAIKDKTAAAIGAATKASKGINGGVIAVLAVAVVAVVAIVAVLGGVFKSPKVKVATAVAKTVENDTILSTLVAANDILSKDALTVDAKVSAKDDDVKVDMAATLAQDVNKGQLYADADIDVSGLFSQKVQFYYDDTKIQVAAPDIMDEVIEYDYTKKNNGFLADTIEENTDGSISDVNDFLLAVSEVYKNSPEYRKEVTKQVAKVYNEIEFEKIDSEKFEIDGKDRTCKGYGMKLKDKDLEKIFKASVSSMDKVYGKSYKKMFDALANLTGEDISMDDIEDEFDGMFDGMGTLKIKYYIYKGMLAAVEIKAEDGSVSIQFQGGDTRTSNIKMVVDDGYSKTTIKRKSSVNGGKEKGEISAESMDLLEYVYDTKTGKLEIDPAYGSSIELTFLVKNGKIDVAYDGKIEGVKLDASLTISDGAKIKALNGKIFDLGSADEDDLEELVEDIADELDIPMYGMTSAAPAATWDDYDDYATAEEYYDDDDWY